MARKARTDLEALRRDDLDGGLEKAGAPTIESLLSATGLDKEVPVASQLNFLSYLLPLLRNGIHKLQHVEDYGLAGKARHALERETSNFKLAFHDEQLEAFKRVQEGLQGVTEFEKEAFREDWAALLNDIQRYHGAKRENYGAAMTVSLARLATNKSTFRNPIHCAAPKMRSFELDDEKKMKVLAKAGLEQEAAKLLTDVKKYRRSAARRFEDMKENDFDAACDGVKHHYKTLIDNEQRKENNVCDLLKMYRKRDEVRMQHRHRIHAERIKRSQHYAMSHRVLHGWPHRKARIPYVQSEKTGQGPVVPTEAQLTSPHYAYLIPSTSLEAGARPITAPELAQSQRKERTLTASLSTMADGDLRLPKVPPRPGDIKTFRPRTALSDIKLARHADIAESYGTYRVPQPADPSMVRAVTDSGMGHGRIVNTDMDTLRGNRQTSGSCLLRQADPPSRETSLDF